MKTYQVYLHEGLTKEVRADGYQRVNDELVFFKGAEIAAIFPAQTVLMVDEVEPATA